MSRAPRHLAWPFVALAACGAPSKPSPFDQASPADPVIASIKVTEISGGHACPGQRIDLRLSGLDTQGRELGWNWLAPEWTATEGVTIGEYKAEDMELSVMVPDDVPALAGAPISITATLRDHPEITTTLTVRAGDTCNGELTDLEFKGAWGASGADGTEDTGAGAGKPGQDAQDAEVEIAQVTNSSGARIWLLVGRRTDGEGGTLARLLPVNTTNRLIVSVRGGNGGDGGAGFDDEGKQCKTQKPGGAGGPGGDGGTLVIRTTSLDVLERLDINEIGGGGGKGGMGGIQCADGSASGLGKPGKPGKPGKDGKVTKAVVPAARLALVAAYLATHPNLKLAD